MKAREHRLYLMRLVAKLWHLNVHMSILFKKNRAREAFGNLAYLQDHSPNLEQKYSEALSVFRQNLQELGEVLKDFTKDGNRVLFIYHPHLEHLRPDAAGVRWSIVSVGGGNETARVYHLSRCCGRLAAGRAGAAARARATHRRAYELG